MKGGLPFRESQLVLMQQDILGRTQSPFPHHRSHYCWLPLPKRVSWTMSTPDEAEARWCQMASWHTAWLDICPRFGGSTLTFKRPTNVARDSVMKDGFATLSVTVRGSWTLFKIYGNRKKSRVGTSTDCHQVASPEIQWISLRIQP